MIVDKPQFDLENVKEGMVVRIIPVIGYEKEHFGKDLVYGIITLAGSTELFVHYYSEEDADLIEFEIGIDSVLEGKIKLEVIE